MSMLYFHCHIVISSSLKYAVFIISYVALYHFRPKITIGTFHIFVRQNCTHLTILVRFYLLYFDQLVYKKAKSALCFARIAKAILGDVTLHNSNFLLIKENPGECFPVHKNVHSGIRINIGLCSITQWMSLRNLSLLPSASIHHLRYLQIT